MSYGNFICVLPLIILRVTPQSASQRATGDLTFLVSSMYLTNETQIFNAMQAFFGF